MLRSVAVGELWDVLDRAQVDAEAGEGCHATTPGARAPDTFVPTWAAMRGRRSVRELSDIPVPVEQLSLVLDRAMALERELFGGDETRGSLTCLVLLGTDELVEPLRHEEGAAVRTLETSRARALRESYCDAPALLFIGADLGSVLSREGVSGYRRTMMRIGGLAQATWLVARDEGLESSVYARASEEVSRLLTESRGTGWRHVFTLALGKA